MGRRRSAKDSSSLAILYGIRSVVAQISHHHLDFNNAEGVIFVVDSSDRDRIPEAKEELHMLMNNEQLRDSLLLVFANKQDMPDAMSASELTDKLELQMFRQRTWYIQVRIPCPYGSPALMCVSQLVQLQAKACTKALNGWQLISRSAVRRLCS